MAAPQPRSTAAFPRPGRAAGCSGSWTSPVSRKAGAPHPFHGPLRAPWKARETRSTLVAGRAAGSGRASGLHFV